MTARVPAGQRGVQVVVTVAAGSLAGTVHRGLNTVRQALALLAD